MGMYTELVLKCRVSKTVPDEVKRVINYLFNGGEKPIFLPEHAFFECNRWSHIGKSSSYYHHPQPLNDYHDVDYSNEIYIFSRSDLKNYDDEISKFINWVTPYIDGSGDGSQCIGWSWYEEDDKPTLIII